MAGYTKRPDKKTIVAIVIIAVLLIAAIVGTVVFLKNRGTAEATDLASYNEQETGTTQEERPTTTDTQEQSGEPATQNAEEQETEGTEPAENPTTTEPTEVAGTEDGETTTAGGNQDTTGTGTTGNTGAGTTAGGTGTQTTGGTAGGATETANAGTTTTTDNIQETTISREETIVHPNQLVAKGEDKVWAPTELNASFASAYTNIENVQTPDITVTKTATTQSGNALVQPGETILYTITVQNNTDEKIERIYVTDAIPTGTTYVSSMGNAETFPKESENVTSLRWLVDVDANGTTTVEFSVIVNEDAGTISNVAIANGESSNETQTSIMTTSKTSVINDDSNIKVAKIGDKITYTITVKNTGEADGSTTVKDDLSQILQYVTTEGNVVVTVEGEEGTTHSFDELMGKEGDGKGILVNLPAGKTATVVFSVNVTSINGELKNVAVIGDNEEGNPEDVVDTLNITGVKENKDEDGVVKPGDTVTYEIKLSNSGTIDGTTTVVDNLPVGVDYVKSYIGNAEGGVYNPENRTVTWENVSVAKGTDTTVLKVEVKITTGVTAETQIKNTGTVEGTPIEDKDPLDVVNITGVKENKDEDGVVKPGDTVTYEIKLSNSGTIDGTTTVVDNLPVGVDYVKSYIGNAEGGVYNPENRTVTWENVSVAKGTDTTVLKVEVKITTGVTAETQIKNTGTVEGTPIEDKDPLDVVNITGVKENKDEDGVVKPGDTVTYEIKLSNSGTIDGTTTVVDNLPVGVDYVKSYIGNAEGGVYNPENRTVTWENVSVAKGTDTTVLKVEVKITTGVTAETQIKNTGTVEGTPIEDKDPLDVVNITGVKENKDEDGVVKPGDTVTYEIKLSNSGTIDGTTTVVDNLPVGVDYVKSYIGNAEGGVYNPENRTVTWENVSVAKGTDTTVLKVEVKITTGVTAETQIKNTGTVEGTPIEDKDPLDVVNITGVKENKDEDGVVKPGDTVTYEIKLSNSGTIDGTTTVVDNLPAGVDYVKSYIGNAEGGVYNPENRTVTWENVSVAKGTDTTVLKVEVKITTGVTAETQIKNTGTVEGTPIEDKDPLDTVDIRGTKTHTANLNADGTINPGTEFTYTITLTNNGTVTGTTRVTDELNSNQLEVVSTTPDKQADGTTPVKNGNSVDFGEVTVEPGIPKILTITVKVKEDATGTIENTAYINEGKPVEDPEDIPIDEFATITARKLHDEDNDDNKVKPGDEVEYTIILSNSGNVAGTTTVSDTLPKGVIYINDSIAASTTEVGEMKYDLATRTIIWEDVTVPRGTDTVTLTFRVTVDETATDTILNSAVVSGDPVEDEKPLEVVNITATKDSNIPDGTKATVGQTVTYDITATNNGTVAGNAVITDEIPTDKLGNVQIVTSTVVKGDTAVYENGVVTWNVNNLEPGTDNARTLQITATINNFEGTATTITNGVKVDNSEKPDDEEIIDVGKAEIHSTKTSTIIYCDRGETKETNIVHEGDKIRYTITVNNDGTVGKEIDISDEIKEGLSYVNGSLNVEFAGEDITETSGATVETADGKQVVKLNDYTLGTTGTLKIEFTVEVNPLADGVTSNKIDKNVATVDGVPTEDGKEYDVEKPVISTTKTSSITSCGKNQTEGTIVHEGDQITYRIEITNSGKASGDVKVQDTLPTGVIYVEGSLSAKVDNQAVSGITASGNTISGTYELEAGKTLVIEFRVTVDRLPEGEYGTTIKANNVTVNDGTPTTDKTGDYTVVKPHIKQSKESEITECAEFNQLVGNTVHEGDKIKYTIIVENDGTDSDVVTVTDVIPSGVTLDKDTLQANVTQGEEPQVNTSTVENNKTQVAVNAYKLEGGAILTITFKVTVNDLGKNVYSGTIEKNVANVNGVPTPDDSGYEVEKPQTEATKSVDKDKASYGDILTYKITVKNLSSVTAPVNISDEIPVGTEYVSNSITVNGNKVSDEGHYVVNGDEEKVVYTGELTKQDETLTLTFQVKVTEQTLGKDIVNIANVNGDEPKATTKVVKKVYSTVTSDRPIDLILVLDVSTSMDYYSRLSNMKTAAKSMIDELFPDGEQTDSTVSLITFASSAETKLTTKGYSDKDTVNNTITRLGTKSGTNINNALDEVNSLITSESDKLKNGKPVVVFLSDGAPTQPFYITGRNNNIGNWGTSNGDYSQNTETNIIEKAKSLNQKATVYSIGLGIDKLATDRGDNDAQKAALYTLCPNSDEADITVTKSYTINGETTTENKASSGDKVEYTITLTNNGNKNVNATVTDKAGDRDDITINNISNGGNSSSSWSNLEVGWNDITIPAKGTVTLTYTVTVKDGRYWDREITISTNGTEVNVPKTSCGASNCIKADDGNYYHWESEQSYARRILKDNIASSPDKYKEATDGSESTLKDIFNQIFNETQKETTTHYIEEELPATVKISETRKLDGDTVQVKIGETTKTYRISDLKNGVDGIRYIENVGFEWTVTEELATSELSLEYKVSE